MSCCTHPVLAKLNGNKCQTTNMLTKTSQPNAPNSETVLLRTLKYSVSAKKEIKKANTN